MKKHLHEIVMESLVVTETLTQFGVYPTYEISFDGTHYVDWTNKKVHTPKHFRWLVKEGHEVIKYALTRLTEIETEARADNEWCDGLAEYVDDERAKYMKMRRMLDDYLRVRKKVSGGIDLEQIKKYPIPQLVELKQGKARCLWHSDKTPSMHYYPKDNHVYCFGCNRGGSVIDVVMAQRGVPFLEAVRIIREEYGHN